MTINFVYISFIVMVTISIVVSIYFTLVLIYNKLTNKKIAKKSDSIFEAFKVVMGKQDGEYKNYMKELENNFTNLRDIRSFYLAHNKYINQYDSSDELIELLNRVVDYERVIKSRIVKKSYRISYALHLISEFKINRKEVEDLALDSLESESVYVRNNALRVINSKGSLSLMMKAVNILVNSDKYFNNRIATDFLDNYSGDKNLLDSQIIKEIEDYNDRFKALFIEHLINTKNSKKEIRDKVLEFLASSNDKKVLRASSKYFFSIIDKRAAKYILKNMSNNYWSVRGHSASSISKYPSKEAIEKLKELLEDSSYYVRKDAAFSLVALQSKEELFTEAYYNKNPLSREILAYAINTMEIDGFKEFKKGAELRWE